MRLTYKETKKVTITKFTLEKVSGMSVFILDSQNQLQKFVMKLFFFRNEIKKMFFNELRCKFY